MFAWSAAGVVAGARVAHPVFGEHGAGFFHCGELVYCFEPPLVAALNVDHGLPLHQLGIVERHHVLGRDTCGKPAIQNLGAVFVCVSLSE